ncbi:MAG TPA: hypothetical protein VF841_16735 [Anaeromyxobacter sp.]
MRTTHYAADGRVVCGNVKTETFEEARYLAARWNRGEERPEMRVAVVRASDGRTGEVWP